MPRQVENVSPRMRKLAELTALVNLGQTLDTSSRQAQDSRIGQAIQLMGLQQQTDNAAANRMLQQQELAQQAQIAGANRELQSQELAQRATDAVANRSINQQQVDIDAKYREGLVNQAKQNATMGILERALGDPRIAPDAVMGLIGDADSTGVIKQGLQKQAEESKWNRIMQQWPAIQQVANDPKTLTVLMSQLRPEEQQIVQGWLPQNTEAQSSTGTYNPTTLGAAARAYVQPAIKKAISYPMDMVPDTMNKLSSITEFIASLIGTPTQLRRTELPSERVFGKEQKK